jgi:hypothetical protein
MLQFPIRHNAAVFSTCFRTLSIYADINWCKYFNVIANILFHFFFLNSIRHISGGGTCGKSSSEHSEDLHGVLAAVCFKAFFEFIEAI